MPLASPHATVYVPEELEILLSHSQLCAQGPNEHLVPSGRVTLTREMHEWIPGAGLALCWALSILRETNLQFTYWNAL